MTSFINQTIARDMVNARIRDAKSASLGRELRQSRRAARAAESASEPGAGASGPRVSWVRRLGLAAAAR